VKKQIAGMLLFLFLFGFGKAEASAAAEQDTSRVANASQMTAVEDVVKEGMTPVFADALRDGVYKVEVDCSSSMFRIENCELTVADGTMTARLDMSSLSYGYLFPGTAEQAAAAEPAAYIPSEENAEGKGSFVFPVEALDEGVPCAAWSKNKELWYDRTLVFRADSLPLEAYRDLTTAESLHLADGAYTVSVTLGGGSGRARVRTPCRLWVEDGAASAEIVWGSANYDYMIVNGEKILTEIIDGHSTCVIPVAAFDRALAVIADTTAMSQPHEIAYTLFFDASTIAAADRMVLRYAEQFDVVYDEAGCALVSIGGEDCFVIVPEGAEAPASSDVPVLVAPLQRLYIASSSAMDPFVRLDALDAVRLTGTKREDWTLPEVQGRMDAGDVLYAGKYAAPDYELLLSEGTALAVENTMIWHSPETKEQLEALGIPVLVERSSYEHHPLGRLEWIKLYGLLTGKTAEAEAFFDAQAALAEQVMAEESTDRTAAFFSVSANGAVSVRSPEDYIARSIALAGGRYVPEIPSDDGAGARSTLSIQPESFYAGARDADVLFYNATVGGGPGSVDELLGKADWLADFRAVQNGEVWCTEADLFQQSSGIALVIDELHQILCGTADETALQYFHRLR
jgi:iron complex transport system substrate-binding protein